MTELFYVLVLAYAVGLTFERLYRQRGDVMLGLFFGTIYFVLVPLGILLVEGDLTPPKLFRIEGLASIPFSSYEYEVQLLLVMVASTLALTHLYSASSSRKQADATSLFPFPYGYGFLGLLFLLYLGTSAFVFLKEGLVEGGHWFES